MTEDGVIDDVTVDDDGLDVAIGDCFVDGDPLETADCDEEHDPELFALAPPAHVGEDYPGRMSLDSYAWGWCEIAFADYVGTFYMDSELALAPSVPRARRLGRRRPRHRLLTRPPTTGRSWAPWPTPATIVARSGSRLATHASLRAIRVPCEVVLPGG